MFKKCHIVDIFEFLSGFYSAYSEIRYVYISGFIYTFKCSLYRFVVTIFRFEQKYNEAEYLRKVSGIQKISEG